MENFKKFNNRIRLLNSKSLFPTKKSRKKKQLETIILGLNNMSIDTFNKIDNIKNIFNKFKLIQGNIEDIEKGDFSIYTIEKDYEEK